MEGRNSTKNYLIQKPRVSRLLDGEGKGKKRGPQNEGKSNDVVENKCRKNVSLCF